MQMLWQSEFYINFYSSKLLKWWGMNESPTFLKKILKYNA